MGLLGIFMKDVDPGAGLGLPRLDEFIFFASVKAAETSAYGPDQPVVINGPAALTTIFAGV